MFFKKSKFWAHGGPRGMSPYEPFGPMGPGDRLDLKDLGLKDLGPMGPGAHGPIFYSGPRAPQAIGGPKSPQRKRKRFFTKFQEKWNLTHRMAPNGFKFIYNA